MNEARIRQYAHLIAVTGVNVQKGQPVIIQAAVDQHAFATMVMEECYKAGASWVRVDWSCQPQTLLHFEHQSLETLSRVPAWREAQLQQMADEIPARIHISSEDPAGLAGIDLQKMQQSRRATFPIIRKYMDQIEHRSQWTIAAVPSEAWAVKVFPELSPADAVEKLWEAILSACRVTGDNDPVQAWREHDDHFVARCRWLNEQHFDAITYKSANGTDFRAELIPQGVWCGGGESNLDQVCYNPNMPTEEIFTSPMRGKAEGTLVSTMPLSYQGQMIDHFSITFHDGRAVSWQAETGEELLGQILTMDEGAACLGELALVPESSPIRQSGILFYNTLFDENACCHAAVGRGFNDCIENYQQRTDEECKALGVNESMIHVDFMIGAPDLCITGWRGGEPTPIFVNGEWAHTL